MVLDIAVYRPIRKLYQPEEGAEESYLHKQEVERGRTWDGDQQILEALGLS